MKINKFAANSSFMRRVAGRSGRGALIACIACCLAGLGGVATADEGQSSGEKVLLSSRPKPGKYVTTQQMDMAQEMAMPGMQAMKVELKQTMVMAMDVSKPDSKGNTKIVLTFRKIKQDVDSPAMKMSYDSEGAPEKQAEVLANVYKPLMKTVIEITMDAAGAVTEVKGLDKLWDSLGSAGPQQQQMIQSLNKSFGSKGVKEMFGAGNLALPDKPVGVGDTWTHKMPIPMPMLGNSSYEQKMKVASIKNTPQGKMVTLAIKGSMKMPEGAKVNGAKIDDFSLDQTGSSVLNADNPPLADTDMSQKMSMKVTAQGPNGQSRTMTMTQQMKMSTSVKKDTGGAAKPE